MKNLHLILRNPILVLFYFKNLVLQMLSDF